MNLNNKFLHFNEAERVYVYELATIEETASKANVSPRTIAEWKIKGDWDVKRKRYLKSKQAFHEELYEFARKILRDIKTDWENGEQVDTGRMYSFTRMLPLITKIKEYEDVAALMKEKDKKKESKGLTKEVIRSIEENVLGMSLDEPE